MTYPGDTMGGASISVESEAASVQRQPIYAAAWLIVRGLIFRSSRPCSSQFLPQVQSGVYDQSVSPSVEDEKKDSNLFYRSQIRLLSIQLGSVGTLSLIHTIVPAVTTPQVQEYWLPGFGLSRNIVLSNIQYFLGPSTTVRPYTY